MILWELFITFFKIGAFTFGGGYAMIPLIQSEVVSNGWLTEAQITDFIAVSESTPGPLAVNMSTYVGAEIAGFAGALCATLGVVMPSFIIILIVAKSYELLNPINT
jgi:chromate transporter